jgi:hypothetical protein
MEDRRWKKSSRSQGTDNCVEVAHTLDGLRDSKNPGVTLPVTRSGWGSLLRSLTR